MMLKSFLPLLLVLAISFEVASCIRPTFDIAKLDSAAHFTASSLLPNTFGFRKRVEQGILEPQPHSKLPPNGGAPETSDFYVNPTKNFVILHDVPSGQNPIHNP